MFFLLDTDFQCQIKKRDITMQYASCPRALNGIGTVSFTYIFIVFALCMFLTLLFFLYLFFSYDAVDIDNVRAKFSSFGQSLMKGGTVLSYVINVFCRVLFNNNHPLNSKRHYFFSSIGVSSYFSNLCFFLLMLICYIFFGMFISLLIFFSGTIVN